MVIVPYVYNSTVKDYVLGSTIYDISAIIGDSIVIEQSEGSTTTKDNEFDSQPIVINHSGSGYSFTAQCLDMQDNALKALFNVKTAINRDVTPVPVNGAVAFNEDFTPMFALIKIGFDEKEIPDVILPMVQMNNRLFIQQMRTRASQGNMTGVALSCGIAIKDKDNDGKVLDFGSGNDHDYAPDAPVLFVPKGYTPLFQYDDKTDGVRVCHQVDFSGGGAPSTVYVNPSNGNWSNSYTPQ
jgi:hypothetical protein